MDRLPQFTECFPKFAAQNKDKFTNLWDEHRMEMKDDLWVRLLPVINPLKAILYISCLS